MKCPNCNTENEIGGACGCTYCECGYYFSCTAGSWSPPIPKLIPEWEAEILNWCAVSPDVYKEIMNDTVDKMHIRGLKFHISQVQQALDELNKYIEDNNL